ncbi:MAG: SOS response-associated peptidase family protein, partial [Pirellulaceae bacterium]|nr:SOS response-associated peptidase family protein [Pirellulaceae bacterium]
TILTTSANRLTQSVHHRMPVILPPEDHDLWLSKAAQPTNLIKLLKPAAEGVLAMYPVSKLVNSPRYDQPDCIESVELAE